MSANDFKIGDKVIIHCKDTRDEYRHKFYDNQVGKIIHIYDLDKNPWGNIVVILENKMQNGFLTEELELISSEEIIIMKQYIDKSDLIAKIEKLKTDIGNICNDYDAGFWDGRITAFDDVICALNTIEVKEVDLEKEVDKWYNTKAPKEFDNVLYRDIEKCAEYFFELGFQAAQKGE